MLRGLRKALVMGAAAIFLLTGCAVDGLLANRAVETNIGLEQANNQMLLLNIIRGTEARPMYFTALKDFQVNSKISGGTGALTIPFGQAATHSYSIAPSLSAESSPQVGIDILDDKDFIDAMYSVVSAETLGHFIRQGWPRELLLHMFVREISIAGKTFKNDPDEKADLNAFSDVIKTIAEKGKISRGETTYVRHGPWIPKDKFYDSKVVAQFISKENSNIAFMECKPSDVIKKKFANRPDELNDLKEALACPDEVMQDGGKGPEKKSVKGFVAPIEVSAPDVYKFEYNSGGSETDTKKKPEADKKEKSDKEKKLITKIEKSKKSLSEGPRSFVVDDDPKKTKKPDTKEMKMTLRTPQGMIYYLSEVTRERWSCIGNNDKKEKDCDKPSVKAGLKDKLQIPLFKLEKGGSDAGMAVSVTFEGERYGIEKGRTEHASLMALTLVSQIIDRQKDPKNRTSQPTINLFAR